MLQTKQTTFNKKKHRREYRMKNENDMKETYTFSSNILYLFSCSSWGIMCMESSV